MATLGLRSHERPAANRTARSVEVFPDGRPADPEKLSDVPSGEAARGQLLGARDALGKR
jgi:hypothetical protein